MVSKSVPPAKFEIPPAPPKQPSQETKVIRIIGIDLASGEDRTVEYKAR